MKDNDIIRALECCASSNYPEDCADCFYIGCTSEKGCVVEMMSDALDLIKRQQAEIERLKSILIKFLDEINIFGNKHNIDTTNFSLIPILEEEKNNLVKQIKSEARKEFAERLHKELDFCAYDADEMRGVINNLLAEMDGKEKECESLDSRS